MKTARPQRSTAALLLSITVLLVTGCLELVGQRITIRHDAAKDELHFLLHYDGVHDSGNNQHGDGAEQVAAAVRNGEFMILDWPFLIQPKQMAAQVGGTETPAVQALAKHVNEEMDVKTVGFFRDPDGRIGGAQLITIRKAKAFIATANDAISFAILEQNEAADPKVARTWQLIRDAAGKKHQWLSLDGHALKATVPIHAREWAVFKASGLLKMADALIEGGRSEEAEIAKGKRDLRLIVAGLTSASIAYSDADGVATLRIGDTKSSSTLRIEMGKEYKPNLVEAISKAASDLDEVMAKLMVGEKVEKSELVAEVMNWGPPEEKVRGLMRMARADDAKLAAKAVKKLEAFGEQWNKTEGYPKAPAPAADTEQFLQAWAGWYNAMLRFPVGAVPEPQP